MWHTKRNQAILEVLRMAHKTGAPLPVAVEYVRAEIRGYVRAQRKRARELRRRAYQAGERRDMCLRWADSQDKIADRNVRFSQTIRRLQREFASWRGPVAYGPWQPVACVRSVSKRLAA
jgi:hypothetical protein